MIIRNFVDPDLDECIDFDFPVKVLLLCNKTFIDESLVEFLGISSDMQERDILEFKCPLCGDIHKSLRFT